MANVLKEFVFIILLSNVIFAEISCPYYDWKVKEIEGNLVCSTYEPTDVNMMPAISNGYVGTLVSSGTKSVRNTLD